MEIGLFERAISRMVSARISQRPGGMLTRSLPALSGMMGPLTQAGKKVNAESAQKLSAFFCGVQIISDAMAILPMGVWQKTDGDLQALEDHRLAFMLSRRPNSYLTSYTLRRSLMQDALLRGDGFAQRVIDPGSGAMRSIKHLEYSKMEVLYNEAEDRLVYRYKGVYMDPEDVIHIKGFTRNGKRGQSVIRHAADNLGISLGAMQYGADSFNSRGVIQGVIETERSGLDPDVKKELSRAWSTALSTGDPYRAAILDEGMKYKSIAISPAESQFIETYASGISDVARWLNLPPHKLKDLTNANYSNIYQMSLEFLSDSLMPWVRQFEDEFTTKCLTDPEIRSGVVISLDENELLRPDIKAKGEYIRAMLLSGVITQNEARAAAGYNKIQGDSYDMPLQPVNMQNQEQLENALNDE